MLLFLCLTEAFEKLCLNIPNWFLLIFFLAEKANGGEIA